MDLITYKGINYPVREVEIDGQVLSVSVEPLNDVLMNDGDFDSEEAQYIDETIYCYVPEEIINLPIGKFKKYVNETIN